LSIGVDIHVVDNDNQTGIREHKLAWHGEIDEAWRDTSQLGKIVLAMNPALAVRDPVPDPLPSGGVGVTVSPFVRIPNSPATGDAPRLNMLKEAPDGSGRLFVIDQLGYLYTVQPDGSVGPYMNVREELEGQFLYGGNQMGSTSFAFHPEFGDNGKLYLVTSVVTSSGTPDFPAKRPIDPSLNGTDLREPQFHDVLLEFTAGDPTANTFSGSFRELLRVEQPYDDHNMGEVATNPNARPGHPDFGLLYVAIADGGNKFPIDDADPENNGQDLSTIHGSIIRIDPMGTNGRNGQYGTPEDNPFVAVENGILPEIWSYGHRNHHRINWDLRGDEGLYAYEMGQASIEEINHILPGANYGWGNREGTFLLVESDENSLYPVPGDEPEDLYTYPVFQYDHPDSSGAIAGGAVYRGSQIPSLYGNVIFADFSSSALGIFYGNLADAADLPHTSAAMFHELDVFTEEGTLTDLPSALLGSSGTRRTDVRIHTDLAGEVYFTNKRNGWIHQMLPGPDDHGIPWPNVFPDGLGVEPWTLVTDSLGYLYFKDWPWLYSYALGWIWTPSATESSNAPGNWLYVPR
jgi:glucose/arabinose dehydrogenase